MLKKTIEYTDYNGQHRIEDHYFNLSKGELVEMELVAEGGKGLVDQLQGIVASKDAKAIINTFKDIILRSYGVRSEDGRVFRKNAEQTDDFAQSEAYSTLFVELVTDPASAAAFINGVVPQDLAQQAADSIGNARPKPQDHLQKQPGDSFQRQREGLIETAKTFSEPAAAAYSPTFPPAPGQQSVPSATQELRSEQGQTTPDELEALRRKLREHDERNITRPPHESGPGYQQLADLPTVTPELQTQQYQHPTSPPFTEPKQENEPQPKRVGPDETGAYYDQGGTPGHYFNQ